MQIQISLLLNSEANCSGSTLFAKTGYIGDQQDQDKLLPERMDGHLDSLSGTLSTSAMIIVT